MVDFEAAGPGQRACIERHLHSAIDPVRHPLATVNDIAMRLGLLVRVPASAEPAEIALGELGGGIERVLVVVEPNASATLIERPATPAHRVVECVLGQGATLRHVRLQPSSESVEYHLVAAHLSDGSSYRLAQYSQGATLRRNDLHVALCGSGAEVDVRCAYRLAPRTHLDTQVGIEHDATHCVSRQTARGVVGERARAVLNGRIHVAPGAQRTDAALTTKTLLLAPTAEINAKPELTIYADDVQCAHGATVGEIDADALFYLRSAAWTRPGPGICSSRDSSPKPSRSPAAPTRGPCSAFRHDHPAAHASAGTAFDVAAVRADFPLIMGRDDIAYLDNAATTQKPRAVLDAVRSYYRTTNANVHRGRPLPERCRDRGLRGGAGDRRATPQRRGPRPRSSGPAAPRKPSTSSPSPTGAPCCGPATGSW